MIRLALLAVLSSAAAAAQSFASGDLVINEVMYDPPQQPSFNEWVEVLNVSGGPLDLSGLVLSDAASSAEPLPSGTTLGAGAYLVLVRDGAAFAAAFPEVPFVEVDGFPALNNSGDRPALSVDGAEIDAVPYAGSWGGADASLERIDPFGPSDSSANFGTSTSSASGTPGAQNSIYAVDTAPPEVLAAEALDAQSVRVAFSEPVEVASAETAANYAVDGGVGAPALAMLADDPAEVVLALATPLTGPRTYTLTVRGVADRRGNAIMEATATFAFGRGAEAEPSDLVINEFLYDEPAADNPGEFVELLNRSDATFDLREFTLNDGTGDDQLITATPTLVGPGAYAVIVEDLALFAAVFPDAHAVEMPSWSALNNGGDAIVLKQRGTVIDSLRYVPSWGGEDASLERKDPDAPSSAANWSTTTDLRGGTPGAQNSRYEPDVIGPQLVDATASPDGRTVTVTIDEPAEPVSVTAAAFSVPDGPAVTGVAYEAGGTSVRLTLAAPLAAGTSTVVATRLTDLLGNVMDRTETTVDFTPDETPPALASAAATTATAVAVTFSEPVAEAPAISPDAYRLSPDGPPVDAVTISERDGGGVVAVTLELGAPLTDRTLYTLVATRLADLAGVVAEQAEARFFVGEPDVPGPGDVIVHEVMFDPASGSDGEYVELLNTTAAAVFDLRTIALDDGDGDASGGSLADAPAVLLPGEPLAVVRDADGFRQSFPEAAYWEAGSVVSLANDGEAVVLRAAGTVLDSVVYDPGWHRVELEDATGISLERRGAGAPSTDAASWSSSLSEAGGTPSAPNTVSLAGTSVGREAGLAITSPFAPTLGEAAEIVVTLSTEAALVRCRVYDGGGRLVRELEPGRLVGGAATLVWDGTGDDRRPLRAGIYVVLVEAVDAEGGTAEAVRGAVVLARPR